MKSEQLIKGMEKLGATTADELLLLAPKGWSDYRKADGNADGESFCGEVTVTTFPEKHPQKTMWTFVATTNSGQIKVSFFASHPNKTTDWNDINPGGKIFLKGELKQFGRHLFLASATRVPHDAMGRIVPVYKGVPKVISSDSIGSSIRSLIANKESVAAAISVLDLRLGLASPGLEMLEKLLWDLHAPLCPEEIIESMEYAKKLSVEAILINGETPKINRASTVPLDWFHLQKMKTELPFTLSQTQELVVEGIVTALESDLPMNALLSGDVGTGKTITYILPAISANNAGRKVAILVPNTPLLAQIYSEIKSFFPEANVCQVNGGKQKCDLSTNPILIGTTGLISFAEKNNWKADFLIIDEQQKFGLEQKQRLTHDATNVLESTATCIPHTLGMIKHSNMQIFRLKSHTKKKLITKIVGEPDRQELVKHIKTAIDNGDRAVIIYPQVNTGEEDFKRNVTAAAEKWETFFPGKVCVLHGNLNDIEKAKVLDSARNGEKPVVVATSIMEVGITIPKLRVGIVVSAERYGVSTLHQMRGRLARDGGEGFFYLYMPTNINNLAKDDPKLKTIERLSALVETQDGFKLAEMDAARRGFGDILNAKNAQHGKTETAFLGLNLTPEDFQSALDEKE
jgi:ATP-dependent DNA helicase RecG